MEKIYTLIREAQLAIMNALNLIEKGKTEVILPSYSCVVVAHAIKKAGLTFDIV